MTVRVSTKKKPAKKKPAKSLSVWLRTYSTAGGPVSTMSYSMRGNVTIQTAFLRCVGFSRFGPITRVEVPLP